MRSRRGLTMIELLLALGLLSMVMTVVAFWTQTAARSSVTLAEPARWRMAAQAVLDIVHDDIASGDFEPMNERDKAEKPRVTVGANELDIKTRSRRPFQHSYRWDLVHNQLNLMETDRQGEQRIRLLLDQVGGWECEIDERKELLTVSIKSLGGQMVKRSFILP